MYQWIATILVCFLVGGLAIMLDRRYGERTIRTVKSVRREHPLTENLGYGFIAGHTPTTRLLAALGLTLFLWYLNILSWYDVVPGFLSVALGIFLEPLFEWVWKFIRPFGKTINETVGSLEKGDMTPIAQASTTMWERVSKAWNAGSTPKPSSPTSPLREAAPQQKADGETHAAPVQVVPTETEEEKAKKAFDAYVKG
jgi:hypothetical protein